MKALLKIGNSRRVVVIKNEAFQRGYVDIIYRQPLIIKASGHTEGSVVSEQEAKRKRLIHYNHFEGDMPIFE